MIKILDLSNILWIQVPYYSDLVSAPQITEFKLWLPNF
jgi:hypothetical protein